MSLSCCPPRRVKTAWPQDGKCGINPKMHNQGQFDPAHHFFEDIFSHKEIYCSGFPNIFNQLFSHLFLIRLFHDRASDLRDRMFFTTTPRMHDLSQIDPSAFQVIKQLS